MADIDAVFHSIASERRSDPLAPVTVIVPSHTAGLQLRRKLAERGAFAGVRFETLPRLAELLGAGHLAAEGRTPLARPISDYRAAEVAQESRGALASVGALAGYARVLRQLFRRLRRGGIRSAQDVTEGERTGHFGEIFRLYGRFRQETSAFDADEDLLETAAQGVRRRPDQPAALGARHLCPPGGRRGNGREWELVESGTELP